MRVYIAGPMRGYPRWNFDAFDAAERLARDVYRLDALNPAAADRADGFDPDEARTFTRRQWHWAMRRDVEMILTADALWLLPGWDRSEGARIEALVAVGLGLPIFTVAPFSSCPPAPISHEGVERACHFAVSHPGHNGGDQ